MLLRAWATRVQDFLETQLSTGRDHATPAPVPCSIFQATQSLVLLAEYLALSLFPTATSYNDLGILLSSFGDQSGGSRSSRSNSPDETTGQSLSRVYFEAGLEVDPDNAHLLANLGSYWKKERNYEEAIRFVSP
jgi:protein O-GlcNAc transferase